MSAQIFMVDESDPIWSSMTAVLSGWEQQAHENWMR